MTKEQDYGLDDQNIKFEEQMLEKINYGIFLEDIEYLRLIRDCAVKHIKVAHVDFYTRTKTIIKLRDQYFAFEWFQYDTKRKNDYPFHPFPCTAWGEIK